MVQTPMMKSTSARFPMYRLLILRKCLHVQIANSTRQFPEKVAVITPNHNHYHSYLCYHSYDCFFADTKCGNDFEL